MLAQQFNFLAVSVVTKSPHPFRSEPRSDGLERHATLLAQRSALTYLLTRRPYCFSPAFRIYPAAGGPPAPSPSRPPDVSHPDRTPSGGMRFPRMYTLAQHPVPQIARQSFSP